MSSADRAGGPDRPDPADVEPAGVAATSTAATTATDHEPGSDRVNPLDLAEEALLLAKEEGLEFEETAEKGGSLLGFVSSLLPLGLGVFGLIGSWDLSIGQLNNPGPGLWPAVLSVALIVIGVLVAFRSRTHSDTEKFTGGFKYVVAGGLCLLVYGLLMDNWGFEAPTLITALVWVKFIGRESWVKTIGAGVGSVAAVYLIFIIGLKVTIPHWLPV